MSTLEECIGKTVNGWTGIKTYTYKNRVRLRAEHTCGSAKMFRCKKDFMTNSQNCLRCGPNVRGPVAKTYRVYESNAERRNIDFTLTIEDFVFLSLLDCFYCGAKPNIVERGNIKFPDFVRNGIDRKDSSVGYVPDNVVPCCWKCNQMKSNLGMEEFVLHATKIHRRFFQPR